MEEEYSLKLASYLPSEEFMLSDEEDVEEDDVEEDEDEEEEFEDDKDE